MRNSDTRIPSIIIPPRCTDRAAGEREVSISFEASAHRQLRMVAADLGVTVKGLTQAVVIDALGKYARGELALTRMGDADVAA